MEDRLYKFAQIVDAGSFTKAATLLHISQPALTAAVKKLERELKTELLVRHSHSFELTPAGRIAYETARDIHMRAANLRTQLATLSGHKLPLRLGAIDAVADLLVNNESYLTALEQHTQLSLTVDSSNRLMELVEQDVLDIALIAQPARLPGTLQATPLGKEPLLFVSPPALVSDTAQGYTHGLVQNFLAYNHASRTYNLIAEHFIARGIHVEPRFYSTSPSITYQLLVAGKGVAVLPFLLVESAVRANTLSVMPIGTDAMLDRNIAAVYRQGKHLSSDVHTLLEETSHRLTILVTNARQLVS